LTSLALQINISPRINGGFYRTAFKLFEAIGQDGAVYQPLRLAIGFCWVDHSCGPASPPEDSAPSMSAASWRWVLGAMYVPVA
jgi:hypothetical protein